MSKIESYEFGKIVVDGYEINSDLIIYPDGTIQKDWWRREGHQLCSDDISKLLETEPELLIIGTGAYGMMIPDDELLQLLDSMGIRVEILRTSQAADLYNKMDKNKCIGLCLHLTC